MGRRYKIRDQEGLFFVKVTGWVDLFIRNDYRECVISSFKHCRDNKGFVSKPEEFVYRSASNYAGEGGVIDVDILE